ncbi:hypothetical protein [Humibacillus xanthopallidus]|uniref:hypothetical protein n=1 Tax=Humibacillus xanthopallidus TaxID=412689 RepID=UPI00163B126B|nr:hypothetical protein [Humibacillus xanthopallidus]
MSQDAKGAMLSPKLDRVAQACLDLFAVDGAGIMLTDDMGSLRYVVATDDIGRRLEHRQLEANESPSIDSFTGQQPVTVQDLAGDRRWPAIGT